MDIERIAANLREVRERIAGAAGRTDRSPESVSLVAVTKYAPADSGMVEALLAAGCRAFGESRPQSLIEKAQRVYNGMPAWHLIGSLQRNKVRKVLPHTDLIHSVDSISLAEAIDRVAVEENIGCVRALLEVNISGDANKHGFSPAQLSPDRVMKTLQPLERCSRLRIDGLMCMSGLDAGADETRREFNAVRRLAEALDPIARECFARIRFRELSMGMSDDFETAIEEGATIVRIGSLLYRS